ncbi:MAG: sigma 54-interacting transcriptional regulator, partial [Acidobacteria bacterium]|nr:sigma 54-interacting transcriptional regulator [Acidobacteriota bacterium]
MTLIQLGRMLLERGRATAAETAFVHAARLVGFPRRAKSADEDVCLLDARIWQAVAQTDAARLVEAESLCRDVLQTSDLQPARRSWAEATLARALLWQGKDRERTTSQPLCEREDAGLDLPLVAIIDGTAVRLAVADGDLFAAGQRAYALAVATAGAVDPLSKVVALTAHLRVLAASGDLGSARQKLHEVLAWSKEARAPLRAARARVIWHDALRRAGRTREARSELDRLARLVRVAPALLRRTVEHRFVHRDPVVPHKPVQSVSCSTAQPPSIAVALLRSMQTEGSDREALQALIDRVRRELRSTRIDLVAGAAHGVEVVATAGSACATRLGLRAAEAGVVVRSADGSSSEIGVPIRTGAHLLGALVCRWSTARDPLPHAEGILELAAALAALRLETWLAGQRDASPSPTSVSGMLGVSAAMADVRRGIQRAAGAPFAVFIEGESGVGKELAARAVHQLSGRHGQRFCDVNCAALPDELLDSELFGHRRGAFTGAVADTAGLFEAADGGTLFLDEVGDLSPRGQAKLLRVLQQHEVRRVGDTFSRKVDVRIVAAANRDMQAEVAAGHFRPDLLYRLNVIRIRIPPLRERPEDVALLARHFWHTSAASMSCGASLTRDVLATLASYDWPGNVRQLQNVMAALAVHAPSRGLLRSSMLPADIAGAAGVAQARLADARSLFERRYVESAL